MKTKTRLKAISALMVTTSLVACGGGSGDSNDKVHSTVTTQHSTVTTQSVENKYIGKTTDASLNINNAGDFAQRVYEQPQSFANKENSLSSLDNILGLSESFDKSPTMSHNSNAGSFHIENNLTNGIGSLSISFNNLQKQINNESHTLNGKLLFNFIDTKTNNNQQTYTTTFDNFESKLSNNSVTGTSLVYGYDKYEKVGDEYKYISNSVNKLTVAIANINKTTVEMTKSFTVIESTNYMGQKEYRMSGDFYVGAEGRVTVSTVTPLIFSSPNQLQYGSFILTGNNNSKVKVVVDNFATSLHVDENGDGTYDYDDTYFELTSE